MEALENKSSPEVKNFSEEGVVHIGSDGWLFLWGGSNDVYRYYTEPDYFTNEDLCIWGELLDGRNKRLTDQGIQYLHFVVPDKITLYPEFLTVDVPHFDRHPINLFNRYLGEKSYYLDILEPLRSAKALAPVYYKTDTHWDYYGCNIAYDAVCQRLGVIPRAELKSRPYGDNNMALDLGSKLTPPIKEDARFFRVLKDAQRIFANEKIIYNETTGFAEGKPMFVGCYAVFKNPSETAEQKKLLVFGDSYCEFRPHLLTGLFAETFSEVHFVWSSNIDYSYVEEIKPDIVITEIAERFVKQIPTDNVNLR